MKQLKSPILAVLCFISMLWAAPWAHSLEALSNSTINDAIQYGMENQEMGLSLFMGNNWREGSNGTLLNIYTPYMEIARSAAHRKFTRYPEPEDIAKARQTMVEDISYIWHHPTVKFMVSLYGDNSKFAQGYYAVVEGTGRGRKYTAYPAKSIRQFTADMEEGAAVNPYTAINAYHFNFKDIAPMEEFELKLYGKDLEPIRFKIVSRDIR